MIGIPETTMRSRGTPLPTRISAVSGSATNQRSARGHAAQSPWASRSVTTTANKPRHSPRATIPLRSSAARKCVQTTVSGRSDAMMPRMRASAARWIDRRVDPPSVVSLERYSHPTSPGARSIIEM